MFCTVTAVVALLLVVAGYIIERVLRSLKVGKITEKNVFITGCDSGFGHLAAVRLDQLGFIVFAGCLTPEGAKSLSETCSSRLTTVPLDIGKTESIEQTVQLVQRKLPQGTGLWALINNAGIVGLWAPSELCSREEVHATLNVNLLGLIDMTRHFLPLIRKSKGRIVNTTSISGRLGFAPIPYTVSKFAAEGFSQKLRRELRSQGIKVSIVEPGAFRTPIFNAENIVGYAQKALDKCNSDVLAVYGGSDLIKTIRGGLMQLYESASPNYGLVVDAYEHAITSKYPRSRYVVGSDAVWLYIPLTYLPDCISDLIVPRVP